MRIAFIADIHGNLPALKAVLTDIKTSGADELVCLGDVVGYGAHPSACVELVGSICGKGVMGNHDFYATNASPAIDCALADPGATANPVWAGIRHAREQLDPDQLAWLRALPPINGIDGDIAAHAALHDFDDWPYLRSLRDARPTLELLDGRVGFFGHTHRENVFYDRSGPAPERLEEGSWRLPPDTSVAITAGSAGQPRDGDPRARWLEWDSETRILEFHRVPYDHRAAADAILAAGLPEASARRLLP